MRWSLLVLLFSLGCIGVRADPQPFPQMVPSELTIYVGGPMRKISYSVTFDKGVLRFQEIGTIGIQKALAVHPSLVQWNKFIGEINEVHLYQWSKEYPNRAYPDGTQWSVDLEIHGRKFHSTGWNNYPTAGNEAKPTNSPDRSPPFNKFCEALSHLIGEKIQ